MQTIYDGDKVYKIFCNLDKDRKCDPVSIKSCQHCVFKELIFTYGWLEYITDPIRIFK